jgi:hypothetical protein
VISGELYHQMGEKLDANSGDQLKPGAFVYLPGDDATLGVDEGRDNRRAGDRHRTFGLDYIDLPTIRAKSSHMRHRVRASLNGASDKRQFKLSEHERAAHLPHTRSPIEAGLPEATAPFTREKRRAST